MQVPNHISSICPPPQGKAVAEVLLDHPLVHLACRKSLSTQLATHRYCDLPLRAALSSPMLACNGSTSFGKLGVLELHVLQSSPWSQPRALAVISVGKPQMLDLHQHPRPRLQHLAKYCHPAAVFPRAELALQQLPQSQRPEVLPLPRGSAPGFPRSSSCASCRSNVHRYH